MTRMELLTREPKSVQSKTQCRFCNQGISYKLISLGEMPLGTSYLNNPELNVALKKYPLDVLFCHYCFLVQLAPIGKSSFDLPAFFERLKFRVHEKGVAKMTVPSLLPIIKGLQFELIRHDKPFYFSLFTLELILKNYGLKVFDAGKTTDNQIVLEIKSEENLMYEETNSLIDLREEETTFGFGRLEIYLQYEHSVKLMRRDLLEILDELKLEEEVIVGYGASPEANTLLNYCGIENNYLDCVVGNEASEEGRFLMGFKLEVVPMEELEDLEPSCILILDPNLKEEAFSHRNTVGEWGGKFLVVHPTPEVIVS